jgi:hypothetical protein
MKIQKKYLQKIKSTKFLSIKQRSKLFVMVTYTYVNMVMLRGNGRSDKWLTGNTKALLTDGSSTTVTTQFPCCNCGISLLLLSSWLATFATRLYAGWVGGRKWSLCNSLCWNKANQNVQHTEEITAWDKFKRFISSSLPQPVKWFSYHLTTEFKLQASQCWTSWEARMDSNCYRLEKLNLFSEVCHLFHFNREKDMIHTCISWRLILTVLTKIYKNCQ